MSHLERYPYHNDQTSMIYLAIVISVTPSHTGLLYLKLLHFLLTYQLNLVSRPYLGMTLLLTTNILMSWSHSS